MVYDVAIVGTGPAALSAALTLQVHEKSIIWIGSKALSDKISKAEKIANFPGLSQVTGAQMQEAFLAQIREAGLSITEGMVNSIIDMGGQFALMVGSDYFEAKTVLLATGVAATGVLPGEQALLGRGVSYCATCDGWLYKGKTIAVLSTSPRFEHEVQYLAELAGKVYFLPRYADCSVQAENVEVINTPAVQVDEENGRVKGLTLKGGRQLEADGIFILRDSISLATLLPGLETEKGHIAVDRQMRTNLSGCFAAGDCTGRPYQYVKAAGEGNVAAHSIVEYLSGR